MSSLIPLICPHCRNDREDEIEIILVGELSKQGIMMTKYLCGICSKTWTIEEKLEGELKNEKV